MAGLVDSEVQHDECGFPYIGGRTLKGLLVEECANLLFALNSMGKAASWVPVANAVFGTPGSGLDDLARLRIGPAQLPESLRTVVQQEYHGQSVDVIRDEILPALTSIRRKTAVDAVTGAPQKETLRTQRVVLRDTVFSAPLAFEPDVNLDRDNDRRMLGLLAACVLALRRGGTDRNRGCGELSAQIMRDDQNVTNQYYDEYFAAEIKDD